MAQRETLTYLGSTHSDHARIAMTITVKGILVSFVVLLVLFRGVEWLIPRERRQPMLRAGFWTDVAYWLFTPFVTRANSSVSVVVAAIPVILIACGRIDTSLIAHGFGPASRLPLWQQAVLILLIGDLLGYWAHRLFHGRRLWRFHAVHHSSDPLDWLSSVRLHPVNDALMRMASAIPVLALGFAPGALASAMPAFTLMAILVHANVDWDWGPLRGVVASPRFHRWHHTSEAEGRDKNFAGLLPLWDILFGTYYMPADRVPMRFGTDTPVPNGLLGQLMFPFRRS
jgi:sterol desaturase/sphingolipid hydroxylase (fatty acid hydroxylase superfamily)